MGSVIGGSWSWPSRLMHHDLFGQIIPTQCGVPQVSLSEKYFLRLAGTPCLNLLFTK